jgi:hypothetical protein
MSRNEDPRIDECCGLEDEGRKPRRNRGIYLPKKRRVIPPEHLKVSKPLGEPKI